MFIRDKRISELTDKREKVGQVFCVFGPNLPQLFNSFLERIHQALELTSELLLAVSCKELVLSGCWFQDSLSSK